MWAAWLADLLLRMTMFLGSSAPDIFGIKCLNLTYLGSSASDIHRYGHLEVVQQLVAAPGINLDQLNQVEIRQIKEEAQNSKALQFVKWGMSFH